MKGLIAGELGVCIVLHRYLLSPWASRRVVRDSMEPDSKNFGVFTRVPYMNPNIMGFNYRARVS